MKKTIFALSVLSFALLGRAEESRGFEQWKYMDVFQSLCRELEMYYVDTIQPQQTIRKGIDAMLESLDPYTNYIPEENMVDLNIITTGEYGGIGALIAKREEGVYISSIYENMPAMEAGLLPGDIFLKINSMDVTKKDQSEVSKLLRGSNNTSITVEVKREGTEGTITKTFRRKKLTLPTVVYSGVVGDHIGYIVLTNFTDKSAMEVKSAFEKLKADHKIRALILDLRNNPGGIMESAIQIVNFFVKKGSLILSTKGKVPQFNRTHRATLKPIDEKIPLAILINKGSASASEIVAGALQDWDRAVLLGSRSFGKGLVQTSRTLPYNGTVKLTSAKYYIPSGRCIQAIDYSHRNADGSVGNIPDSLTKEFKTLKNGRTVKDGGGLVPDIQVAPTTYSNFLVQLEEENLIFDFATYYHRTHSQIDTPSRFHLSDEDYNQFKQFVKEKHFNYDRKSEKMLKKVKELMDLEKVPQSADSAYLQLKEALKPDVDRDLDFFKEEIKEQLQLEICRRYYYTAGAVEHSLQTDEVMKKVLQTMKNLKSFSLILSKNNQSTPQKP